ncbi:MAG: dephospho-CoA kinase [Acidobacteria bacterium]|nr:dephospho-CoA kinase [Acidobacteriota bacterium]
MLRVGLTGGLASGKSFVAGVLRECGAQVIEADKLGHEALLPGGGAYEGVVAEFGEAILDRDGRIDRKRLGGIVFADPDRLAKLNALVHPVVFRRQEEFFEQARAEDPAAVAVVEAAILIETGGRERYDRIVLAVCPPELQIQRFMARENGSEEQARARMARQMPLIEKIPFADYLIDTSDSLAETAERARAVYAKLKAEAVHKVV